MQQKLHTVPCTLKGANEFVSTFHRHHGTVIGHKWALAIADEDGKVRGVAICGRPVARNIDNGLTVEVNRLATDECENACSALYAAARRVAKELGYKHIVTYILAHEPGTSLKAAGWQFEVDVLGDSWDRPNRARTDKHPTGPKQRWGVYL